MTTSALHPPMITLAADGLGGGKNGSQETHGEAAARREL